MVNTTFSKGVYIGYEDIKAGKRFVVYSGFDSFPMVENIIAISLANLIQELLKQQEYLLSMQTR
jgi:hypothetical protein